MDTRNVSARNHSLMVLAMTVALLPGDGRAQDAVGWGDVGFSNVRGIGNNASAVSAGGAFTAIVKTDGSVAAWGLNGPGNPCVLPRMGNAIRLACGDRHLLVLGSNGTVRSFGLADPVPSGLPPVAAIAAGAHHSIALAADGAIHCLSLIHI